MLSGKRGSPAPSICPGCDLLVRPIFDEASGEELPRATPESLAEAISDCVDAGALVVNLSVAVDHSSPEGKRSLMESLNYAAREGSMIVSASGNQGTISCSIITGHSWTIPVAACDRRGIPIAQSNLGISIGRHGLMAPGEGITSLGPGGSTVTLSGTSFAAPFVTGAASLIWSEFPNASSAEVRSAIVDLHHSRRTIVPPLLDAWSAYQSMMYRM
jgi:subtilisin family serine protease